MRLTTDQLRALIFETLYLVRDEPRPPPPGWRVEEFNARTGATIYVRDDKFVVVDDLRSHGMGIEVTVRDPNASPFEDEDLDRVFDSLDDAFAYGDEYTPNSRVRTRF